jgi:hypothetical protein
VPDEMKSDLGEDEQLHQLSSAINQNALSIFVLGRFIPIFLWLIGGD